MIVAMIVVNNPGAPQETFPFLVHSRWHGWTFADTIFPAFLWIVGLTATLSTQARLRSGVGTTELLRHALRRSALLLCVGLLLEGFPRYHLANYDVTGVLQKISVAYLLAFVVYLFTGRVGRIAAIAVMFAGYTAYMLLSSGDACGTGPWSMECNGARRLDELVLGAHRWLTPNLNDSDGIIGTLAAIPSVLIGMLAEPVLSRARSQTRNALWLLKWGAILVLVGLALTPLIPINKPLWTPSYSLLMAGFSSIGFVACYWLVEMRGTTRWLRPLEIFGVNAIAAYALSRVIGYLLKVHVAGESIYQELFRSMAGGPIASLLFALLNVAVVYAIVAWMYHRRIFVKL
jgi:predicted acyltransferase